MQGCDARGITVIKGNIQPDYVHLLISAPPSLSVAQIMQYIKGRSSKKMQEEFNSIRRQFWGQHMWATGYFCRTVGTITKEMSKELNINEVGVGLEINI